jgi:hypothetical protein
VRIGVLSYDGYLVTGEAEVAGLPSSAVVVVAVVVAAAAAAAAD